MIRRTTATFGTLIAAVATVTSAAALDGPPAQTRAETAPAAQPPAPAGKAQPGITAKAAPTKPAAPRPAVKAMMKLVPARAINNDAQAQQYIQQFRPILRAEYHIVRVVCRPDPEQRKAIARDAEQALRHSAKKYVEMMQRPMTLAQRTESEPRRQIREGLAASIKAHLPAEMAAKYREEIARREAGRKQLAVRNLVARLDRDLVLGPDQRDKIADSLAAHWDDSWCSSIEMFMHDYQFLPSIPDQYVAPFLNEPQKRIWRGIQKVQVFFGGFGMMGGNIIDDPLEDDELRAGRLEASRDDPKLDPNQPMMPVMMQAITIEASVPTVKAEAKPAEKAATEKSSKAATPVEKPAPKR